MDEEKESRLPVLIGGAVFLLGWLVTSLWAFPAWVCPVWMAVAAFPLLVPVIGEALEELSHRSMGENTLLVIAVAAAFVIGEWIEGTAVLVLFAIGEWVEDAAMDRSQERIAALTALTPDTALKIGDDGAVTEIPAAEVVAGDILSIPPFARVPADGTVLAGESEADTSALTGESTPVAVAPGTALLSGTVNGGGALTMRAERPTAESAAARIWKLVDESAERKGHAERWITRFARWYTPAVTGAAVLVAVLPPLLFGAAWGMWLYRALVFLVASCPCALVISVPLCFTAGMAAAARRGVLIKGGRFVETLARTRAAAFDKTGTLTTGEMQVAKVYLAPGITENEAVSLAAALEEASTHPAGRAIVAAAMAGAAIPLTDRREVPGQGVFARLNGAEVACGGRRILRDDAPPDWENATVFLLCNGELLAGFCLTEQVRAHAAETVAALHRDGIRTAMLTGDGIAPAKAIAAEVGIDDVRAGLLPEDKLTAVRQMQEGGTVTLFVGDGINDAPVLTAADVGFAMGLGSPAAIETADGVLIDGGVSRLPEALTVSRRVMCTVRQNIGFALGVKAVVLILAVVGIAPMWLAVFADMGVTLLSVMNALRLLAK